MSSLYADCPSEGEHVEWDGMSRRVVRDYYPKDRCASVEEFIADMKELLIRHPEDAQLINRSLARINPKEFGDSHFRVIQAGEFNKK